ncbi:MAG: hypothetical protein LBV21_03930, partial [Candidatus Adiutrix sp.]|nr:hypothetical protein [Candidatus Adiutrix sp.]
MRKSGKFPPKVFAALAALAALAAGCVGGSASSVYPARPEGPALDLARGLYERGESLKTLAARGGADYSAAGRRNFFRFEALVMKPGRLLFTAFDPAGRPAFRLAIAAGRLTGLLYEARQYVTGPATAENFARFLPPALSPDRLPDLLSGA